MEHCYMEQFVNLETVTKSNDEICLRKLFHSMRNLQSLDVYSDNYGRLLLPILNSKLPSDMRTLFARKISETLWDLDELGAKEQASLTVKTAKRS